jgi:hypothetical protein
MNQQCLMLDALGRLGNRASVGRRIFSRGDFVGGVNATSSQRPTRLRGRLMTVANGAWRINGNVVEMTITTASQSDNSKRHLIAKSISIESETESSSSGSLLSFVFGQCVSSRRRVT